MINLTRLGLAAFSLLSTSLAKPIAPKDKVDFNFFEFHDEVVDLLWCGRQNEAVLVKNKGGTVYQSLDRGSNWKLLRGELQKTGKAAAGVAHDIGNVASMIQSPVDDNLVVLLGTNGVNWVTEDCGANIRALNAGKVIEEFKFHPHHRNHAIAASWTNCEKVEEDNKCTVFKELYATEDLGKQWKYLTNYVFDFEWGVSKKTNDIKIKVPEERIFITREDKSTTHQR